MSKTKKLDPNRFKKETPIDTRSVFSFDPVRASVFKWGLAAGILGSVFTRPEAGFMLQMVGILIIVLVSNYHIGKAARRIPRWHATVMAFAGLIVAFVLVSILNIFLLFVLGTPA